MNKKQIATRMVEIVENQIGAHLDLFPVVAWYVHGLGGNIRKPSTVMAEYSKEELAEALTIFEEALEKDTQEKAQEEQTEKAEEQPMEARSYEIDEDKNKTVIRNQYGKSVFFANCEHDIKLIIDGKVERFYNLTLLGCLGQRLVLFDGVRQLAFKYTDFVFSVVSQKKGAL